MSWYYAKNGTQQGPVALEDMKSRIAMGELAPTDLAWREGMSDWMPVASIPELKVEPPPERAEREYAPTPVPGHGREAASDSAAAARPAPAGPYTVPGGERSQGMAIAALVCGIVSLVGSCVWVAYSPVILFGIGIPLTLAAIVLGHISFAKAKKDPARFSGKGMGITGAITGYLGLLLCLLMSFLWFQLNGLSEKEAQEKLFDIFKLSEEQKADVRKRMKDMQKE